jgi:hypothetical protein
MRADGSGRVRRERRGKVDSVSKAQENTQSEREVAERRRSGAVGAMKPLLSRGASPSIPLILSHRGSGG